MNRVAVRKGIRFEILADYEAHIPPAVSPVRCPGHHREWLHIMAEYDAHSPPSVNQVAVRKGIRFEIVADYDAHIPPDVSQVRCPGHHRESL